MSKWVPLLVRSEDYSEFAALVLEREVSRPQETLTATGGAKAPEISVAIVATNPSAVASTDATHLQVANMPVWAESDLARIAEGRTATTERWTRALDVCSETPGELRSTSEVAEQAGMTINEWRDAPRKITRHLKVHYTAVPRYEAGPYAGQHSWPLVAVSVPGSTEVHWGMNAEQAKRWRKVRGHRDVESSTEDVPAED